MSHDHQKHSQVLWATEKAKASRVDHQSDEEEQSFFEDDILEEKEKDELRALRLDEEAEDTSAILNGR